MNRWEIAAGIAIVMGLRSVIRLLWIIIPRLYDELYLFFWNHCVTEEFRHKHARKVNAKYKEKKEKSKKKFYKSLGIDI